MGRASSGQFSMATEFLIDSEEMKTSVLFTSTIVRICKQFPISFSDKVFKFNLNLYLLHTTSDT